MGAIIQEGPYPAELDELVRNLSYRPGWSFELKPDLVRDEAPDGTALTQGLTFVVRTMGYDAYHPERGQNYGVYHYFPVPAATYNAQSWRRWLLDCLIKVETHEACEFFTIFEVKPFAPTHGPGDDPYTIKEYATDQQRRTRFTGEVLDK